MQVGSPTYTASSTICTEGVGPECNALFEPQAQNIYEIDAATLPFNNCMQQTTMKQALSVKNNMDAGSGLSTLYNEASTNSLTWSGLQAKTPEFLQGQNGALGNLHPFPSLKKLWEVDATLDIALSTLTELYTVNSEAFVANEYPPSADGATFTVSVQEMVAQTQKSAVVWACVVWPLGMLAALTALIMFIRDLKKKNTTEYDEADTGDDLDYDKL